jgi:hypothetical protein
MAGKSALATLRETGDLTVVAGADGSFQVTARIASATYIATSTESAEAAAKVVLELSQG